MHPASSASNDAVEVRAFVRSAVVFVLIGLGLYLGVYAASELLVYRYAKRNRFYAVRTAPVDAYGFVILGASHAAALDYGGMTTRLEEMTRSRILNLAVTGGGVTVNRVLLEYFLARHTTAHVVYVVDSFAFYSVQWNEERLNDVRLFHRAPFDPVLARLLMRHPETRWRAVDYVLGFSKVNNPDRFKPDVDDAEGGRFERTYRPVRQIDQQRLEYLYPQSADVQPRLTRYLAELADLIRYSKSRGIRVLVVKPPIPDRIYRAIPREAEFDSALTAMLGRERVEFHDFSLVDNDPKLFFDSDHLNRAGVTRFFENHFRQALAEFARSGGAVRPDALKGSPIDVRVRDWYASATAR